jgi:hypothetical protein
MTPKASPFPSLHFRSRRFSLLLSGRTPFTCTRGLCLAWLETLTNQTPVQCSSTFTILEVVITSEASRAIALCSVTLLSLSSLLKSGLESPSALGCWRYGHHTLVCPFKTQLCAICAGPHQSKHHRVLGACCKVQPKAKPPWEVTPLGHPCPHPACCVNCGLAHSSDSSTCSFWKHHYNPKWVHTKYTAQKVGNELLRFIPTSQEAGFSDARRTLEKFDTRLTND